MSKHKFNLFHKKDDDFEIMIDEDGNSNFEEFLDGSTEVEEKEFDSDEFLKIKSPKKEKHRFRKKENFVELDDADTFGADFVILKEKRNKLIGFITSFKVIFGILSFVILTVLVYLSFSFKVIPGSVKGADYEFNNLSIVSRNYSPNINELRFGDEIICVDDNKEWIPFVWGYQYLEFESRNGPIIYTTDEDGKKHKIQSTNIDYILK